MGFNLGFKVLNSSKQYEKLESVNMTLWPDGKINV